MPTVQSEEMHRRHGLVELWADLDAHADLLLLAGDLTRRGTPQEARIVAGAVAGLEMPVVAVLGTILTVDPADCGARRGQMACARKW